ncbi:MAG: hypothetical protein ACI934_000611 [Pseudohongiellaceae bacterium]|jgi:hypothetical protein
MTIKVIGAGLGRTGTMSLKIALEKLLGGPCYHMTELFEHLEEHTPLWHAAARGEQVDWDQVFTDYVAAVDEPVASQWEAIARYYPDALIVLSVRDPDSWWKSANSTILRVKQNPPEDLTPARKAWLDMVLETYKDIYPEGFSEPEAAKAAFTAHIEKVKRSVPAERLLIWEVSQGWEPLCKALNMPVPDEPFPRSNSTEEFLARRAKDI